MNTNSLILLALMFGSLGASRASRVDARRPYTVPASHRLPRREDLLSLPCEVFLVAAGHVSPSNRQKRLKLRLLPHFKALLDKTDYFELVYQNIEPIREQISSDSSPQRKRTIEIEKQDENICIALCVVAMCRSYKDQWIPHRMQSLRAQWPERDDIIELFEVDERLIREKSPYWRGHRLLRKQNRDVLNFTEIPADALIAGRDLYGVISKLQDSESRLASIRAEWDKILEEIGIPRSNYALLYKAEAPFEENTNPEPFTVRIKERSGGCQFG